jgi:peptide/nickel transport system permease protein
VRVAKTSYLNITQKPYFYTARAVGFPSRTIFFKYMLKNASLPIISLAGLKLGLMFSGAIVTETLFMWPGLGLLAAEAIAYRDYSLIMGILIVVAVACLISSLVVDIICSFVDPRIRLT